MGLYKVLSCVYTFCRDVSPAVGLFFLSCLCLVVYLVIPAASWSDGSRTLLPFFVALINPVERRRRSGLSCEKGEVEGEGGLCYVYTVWFSRGKASCTKRHAAVVTSPAVTASPQEGTG
jgi:hypothetical protein